jgi:heme exporter protein A
MIAPVEIAASHLARRYGRRWALVDVSLTVASGEVLMVAGHNGSGKSTLFRVLSTIIRPDGGSAMVGGLDVVRDRDRIRQSLALLSHASYLYESLTARENLEIVARFLGKKDVMTSLARVGLASRADDPVSTFSAGMRKRVSFARIFLQEPEVVLLDEPYGQLDPAGFALVDEVVGELKARGATVLMATHQVGHVASVADRALLLEQGRVIWSGPAAELPE